MPLKFRSDMDSSGFERGIQRMDHAAEKFGEKFKHIGETLGAGFLVGGVTLGLHEMLEGFTKIRNEAAALSLEPEEFQRLSLAMQHSGATAEEFTKGFAMLIQKLEEAKIKGIEAGGGFDKLRISQEQIDTKSPLEIWNRMSDALHDSAGGTREFSGAMDIFGSRLGVHIIPALVKGSEEMENIGRTAKVAANEVIEAAHEMEVAINVFMSERRNTLGGNVFAISENIKAGIAHYKKDAGGSDFWSNIVGTGAGLLGSVGIGPRFLEEGGASTPALTGTDLSEMKAKRAVAAAAQSASVSERLDKEETKRAEEYGKEREAFEKHVSQLEEASAKQEERDQIALERLYQQTYDIRQKTYEDGLDSEHLIADLERQKLNIQLQMVNATEGETAEFGKQLAELDGRITKEKALTAEKAYRASIPETMDPKGHLSPALTRINQAAVRRADRESYLAGRRFGGSAKPDESEEERRAREDFESAFGERGQGGRPMLGPFRRSDVPRARGLSAHDRAQDDRRGKIEATISKDSIQELTKEIDKLLAK